MYVKQISLKVVIFKTKIISEFHILKHDHYRGNFNDF